MPVETLRKDASISFLQAVQAGTTDRTKVTGSLSDLLVLVLSDAILVLTVSNRP